MTRFPESVTSSTHEVFPPKRAVPAPGAAMEPRVPQKRRCINPPQDHSANRLCKMISKTRLEALGNGFPECVSGQGEDGHSMTFIPLQVANQTCRRVAVHFRHFDVHQNEIILPRFEFLNRNTSVLG